MGMPVFFEPSTLEAIAVRLMELGGTYDPEILGAMATYRSDALGEVVRAVRVCELATSMTLDEDVLAKNGSTVVRAGTELTDLLVMRLTNFALGVGIREPIRVRVRQKAA